MAETIYADQVTNIALHGGVVRLELSVVDELPRAQNEPVKLRVSHHVVLPLDAFVKAFAIEQAMMKKMLQDGVLKSQEKPE